MPNRTCQHLSLALLIGGLSLGMLPPGEAFGAYLSSEEEQAGTVGFRHSVFLREERALHAETPAPSRGEGGPAVSLPEPRKSQAGTSAPSHGEGGSAASNTPRRALQAGAPAPSRSVAGSTVSLPRRRALQAGTFSPSHSAGGSAISFLERRTPQPPASNVSGGGDLWLQPTSFTPYDRYMGTVRSVINHLDPHPATMSMACQLMAEGRHFQYVSGDPYAATPPTVTAREQAGDCKAKALWLFHGLGDADALFVIGKTTRHSRTSHAWVYWRNENRWWILDCTNRSRPLATDNVSQDCYIPYYSYGRNGAYRHEATRLLINPISPNTGTPAVADHSAGQEGK